MNRISFIVPGEPQSQKRHRMGRGHNYDPSAKAKRDFLSGIQMEAPPIPVLGPVFIGIGFYFGRPKSHFGTGKNSGVLKPFAPFYCTKKPDVDNLIKFVLDAMNGVFFVDDAMVCKIVSTKLYSDTPQTAVQMEWE